jgi:Fe-S cluster assembly ATP-binding protein
MKNKHILKIKNLHVKADGNEVVKGLSLEIKSGEIHVIMGPNGSGKSSLCKAVMGHPHYEVIAGSVFLNGEDLDKMKADERAKRGLFLGFQYPSEVPGVTFGNFLRQAVNIREKAVADSEKKALQHSPAAFYPIAAAALSDLKMDKKFIGRSLNDGFSGGEKKRAEVVQMAMLKPKFAMLDEIDSGLDIDALKHVAAGIKKAFSHGEMGLLIVTHYQRILDYIKPDHVHVMANGKIVESGGADLAKKLEKEGYEKFI